MQIGLSMSLTGGGQQHSPRAARLTSPQSISGLTYWLDAQQTLFKAGSVPCTTLGDVIVTAPDQSGSGNTPTASSSPTYDPTGINGHPAISLGGGFFTLPSILTSAYSSALTVFVVAKSSGAIASTQVLFGCFGPNFWFGPNAAAYDVTLAGLTGWAAPASRDGVDGVYSASVGPANAYFECRRNSNGLGGSITTLGKSITGSIAFTGQAPQIGAAGGGSKFAGWIGEVLVYNAALTTEQIRQVRDYLSAKWGYSAVPLVLCVGNSLTSGTGSTGGATQNLSTSGTNYPSRLLSAAAGAYDVRTDAFPGRTLAQLISGSPAYGDKFLLPSTGARQVAVVWEITNTLRATQSISATYAQLAQFCQAKRAWGFKVVVATCLNRQDASTYAGFDADRQTFNARLLANFSGMADAVVDIAAISQLADPSNATYYDPDKIHLTDASYQLVANAVDPVVRALF